MVRFEEKRSSGNSLVVGTAKHVTGLTAEIFTKNIYYMSMLTSPHYIFNPLATKAGLYCCVRPHLMKNARTNHVWFSRLAGFRCKSAKLLQALACCANILVSLWLFPIFGMTTSDLYRKLSLGASRTPSSCSLCSLGSWSTGKTWAVGHAIPVAIFQSPSH